MIQIRFIHETTMVVIVLLFSLAGYAVSGLSQDVPFDFGTRFQRADLDVRWSAPSNALPTTMWVYRALPTKFSPAVMSNLTALGRFTGKDKSDYGTNGVMFESPDKARRLTVNFNWGSVVYTDATATRHDPTNLSVGVPSPEQALKLTREFLPRIGIGLPEISRSASNGEPQMNVFNEEETFYVNRAFITNVPMRGVRFRRAVDGAKFAGIERGGDFQIEFGNHGEICEMEMSWRDLEREQEYKTAAPETIVKWIHEGKAIQITIFTGSIDWTGVKSMTVHNAYPSYLGRERPMSKSWLYPYVALDTTVDTGESKISVELDCPVIDESKPLSGVPQPKPN